MKPKLTATLFAFAAAALYAINMPFSKLLLRHTAPAMTAALLYLGAGVGLMLCTAAGGKRRRESFTRGELPFVFGMIVLDIAAPILLMLGLRHTGSANASLLNNFEIVATSLIAFFLFREAISRRLALAILLVTAASAALSFEGAGSFDFNIGSLCVLGAACCWGLENNCTRMLSGRDSVQVTIIKGVFSGLGSMAVALIAGERLPGFVWLAATMLLGFVAYGLSINFYIRAQRELGAAKTSACYSIAPFLGVLFGMLILGERPGAQFYVGLAVMIAAALLLLRDTL